MDDRTWVLVHGTPLTPAVWHRVAAHLDGRVHLPDTTRVAEAGPNPQATLAAQVVASVDGPFDLVGHSFGGQIALEIALLVPERVRSLSIVCSRDTPFPPFAALASAVRAGQGLSVAATLARWFSPAELEAGGATAEVVGEVRAELERASGTDWAAALDAIAVYDSSARTPGLRMPVQLIGGEDDAVATPAAMAALGARVAGSELHVHPGWHHLSPFIDAEALATSLQRFAAR